MKVLNLIILIISIGSRVFAASQEGRQACVVAQDPQQVRQLARIRAINKLMLPNGEQKTVRVSPVDPDGNCGLKALGFSRKDFVKLVFKNKDNPEYCELINKMIREDLKDPVADISSILIWQVIMQDTTDTGSFAIFTSENHLKFIAKLKSFKVHIFLANFSKEFAGACFTPNLLPGEDAASSESFIINPEGKENKYIAWVDASGLNEHSLNHFEKLDLTEEELITNQHVNNFTINLKNCSQEDINEYLSFFEDEEEALESLESSSPKTKIIKIFLLLAAKNGFKELSSSDFEFLISKQKPFKILCDIHRNWQDFHSNIFSYPATSDLIEKLNQRLIRKCQDDELSIKVLKELSYFSSSYFESEELKHEARKSLLKTTQTWPLDTIRLEIERKLKHALPKFNTFKPEYQRASIDCLLEEISLIQFRESSKQDLKIIPSKSLSEVEQRLSLKKLEDLAGLRSNRSTVRYFSEFELIVGEDKNLSYSVWEICLDRKKRAFVATPNNFLDLAPLIFLDLEKKYLRHKTQNYRQGIEEEIEKNKENWAQEITRLFSKETSFEAERFIVTPILVPEGEVSQEERQKLKTKLKSYYQKKLELERKGPEGGSSSSEGEDSQDSQENPSAGGASAKPPAPALKEVSAIDRPGVSVAFKQKLNLPNRQKLEKELAICYPEGSYDSVCKCLNASVSGTAARSQYVQWNQETLTRARKLFEEELEARLSADSFDNFVYNRDYKPFLRHLDPSHSTLNELKNNAEEQERKSNKGQELAKAQAQAEALAQEQELAKAQALAQALAQKEAEEKKREKQQQLREIRGQEEARKKAEKRERLGLIAQKTKEQEELARIKKIEKKLIHAMDNLDFSFLVSLFEDENSQVKKFALGAIHQLASNEDSRLKMLASEVNVIMHFSSLREDQDREIMAMAAVVLKRVSFCKT